MTPQGSTAMFPGYPHLQAVAFLADEAPTEAYGAIGLDHCQLCPQNHGRIDEALCETLRARYPATRFRLHANVRLAQRLHKFDAATFSEPEHRAYFERMGAISRALDAPAYTLHCGVRKYAHSREVMRDNVRRIQDLMGLPVGVEGLYPMRDEAALIGTWADYRWWLEETDLGIALDLSHLNIVARRAGFVDTDLVRALLASPRLLEIHVSGNDGRADRHLKVEDLRGVWWAALLDEPTVNRQAVLFTEGRQRQMPQGWARNPRQNEANAGGGK